MNSAIRASICCLSLMLPLACQEALPACKDLSYTNRNQTDYGPLRVPAVRGVAQDAQGVAIPRACVGVFTESDHKLIAATETDDSGNFKLKDIKAGEYRLVVTYEGFSPANAKVRIGHSRGTKVLCVQMRPAGLDSGSFVEAK